MMTPRMDWQHWRITASGHLWLVPRWPYPMVCWVSREKRKLEVKSWMLYTHGVQFPDACSSASGSLSSWSQAQYYAAEWNYY